MRYFSKGQYFGFYVDLMGQKELYSSIPHIGKLNNPSESKKVLSTQYVVETAFTCVRSFLSKFKENAQYALDLYVREGYEKYREMSKNGLEDHLSRLEYGTQQFSDSLIFYLKDEGPIAADVFTYIVPLFVLVLRQFLPNKVVYRGSVTCGEGWEAGPNTLEGPVFRELIRLEEQVANYPRIVVGDTLYARCESVAKTYKPGKDLSITDFLGTLCSGFEQDFDGINCLNLCSRGFVSSLRKNELHCHRDIQIASQKFLYNEFKKFSDRASEAHTASMAGVYSKVAVKYAMALNAGSRYCQALGVKEPDYESLGLNYEPLPDNYANTVVDISEYVVLRLSFWEMNGDDIKQSKAVNRAVCLLRGLAQRMVNKSSDVHPELLTSQFANVLVLAIKNDSSAIKYMKDALSEISTMVPRFVSRGVLVRGSLVGGNGWPVFGETLCGPIMQDSYEYECKVAAPFFRIVIDRHAASFLSEYSFHDLDGVEVVDYLKIRNLKSLCNEKLKSRYECDINNALQMIQSNPKPEIGGKDARLALSALMTYYQGPQ